MSIEQDEQIIQEIVGQVLIASLEDNENIGFKNDSQNESHLTIAVSNEDTGNISTHTAKSGDLTEEKPQLPNKEKQQMDDLALEGNHEVPAIDIAVPEVDVADENQEDEGGDKQIDESLQTSVLKSEMDDTSQQVDDISLMNSTNNEEMQPDLLSGGKVEVEKEIENKSGSDFFEGNVTDRDAENKGLGLEPVTPPIFGNTSLQEHQLHQHEQQQQLFNTTSNTETKLTDSGEESDLPSNSGQKTNGNDVDSGKANGSSVGPQGKAEQKTKTKLCNIL